MTLICRNAGLMALVALGFGCGPAVADVVRKQDLSGKEALGAAAVEPVDCTGQAKKFKPLAVDWEPDKRVELEASMKKGLVAVKYDCKSFEIIVECKLDGAYEYTGVSIREKVIKITDMDELSVNLPISSGSLGGEVRSGRTIDLALVMIGMKAAAVSKVNVADMSGCEDVTHFIRSAQLGAFSMATGSSGKVVAAAQLFGVGVGGKSASDHKALNRDGEIASCKKSDPDATAPPSQCRAPLKVELVPVMRTAIVASKGKKKPSPKVPPPENVCPKGYFNADGVCTKKQTVPHLCDAADEADCKAQCDRGHAGSCVNVGNLAYMKFKDAPSAFRAALPSWQKACEAQHVDGCFGVAQAHYAFAATEEGYDPDRMKKAIAGYSHACRLGSTNACLNGSVTYDDPGALQSFPRAAAFAARGCSLGGGTSCRLLAMAYFKGRGVKTDAARGARLLRRACLADTDGAYCVEYAETFAKGRAGLTVDAGAVAWGYERACGKDPGYACGEAGNYYKGQSDAVKAAGYYARGCKAGDEDACKAAKPE